MDFVALTFLEVGAGFIKYLLKSDQKLPN